ncbi:hypothetical protein VTK26DRAFT_2478 [Humicola hyalothermophila]
MQSSVSDATRRKAANLAHGVRYPPVAALAQAISALPSSSKLSSKGLPGLRRARWARAMPSLTFIDEKTFDKTSTSMSI